MNKLKKSDKGREWRKNLVLVRKNELIKQDAAKFREITELEKCGVR